MITQRNPKFIAQHPETGITVQVFQVDCFDESFNTAEGAGAPSFIFRNRYLETETGQKITPVTDKENVCVVRADTNYFLKILTTT
jgi:hypothetical protein